MALQIFALTMREGSECGMQNTNALWAHICKLNRISQLVPCSSITIVDFAPQLSSALLQPSILSNIHAALQFRMFGIPGQFCVVYKLNVKACLSYIEMTGSTLHVVTCKYPLFMAVF